MANYSAVRSSFSTGDIVLFSGKSGISNIIKLFSGGKWSHVGMVLIVKEMGDAVLLWESTTLSNVADVETSLGTKGVQLVPLSQRIANYDGEVLIRKLSKQITAPMHTALNACRKELSRKPYEKNEMELIRAAYDGIGGKSSGEDLSSLFCSELVAEAYQAMGLLPDPPTGAPSNEYTPMDFSERRTLPLRQGYSLGKEVSISW